MNRRTRSPRWLALAIATVLTAVANTSAFAQVEKLVMPGRVITGHADIEGDCAACHDIDSELPQAVLCIECHDDVGQDRTEERGFHGTFPAARDSECVVCHTDHEGRDADIVPVGAGIFDHDFSDFPLNGAHLATVCSGCHVEGEKHRDATTDCVGCHRDDDVHDGELGDTCSDCHSESTWSGAAFDHSNVGYPLTGQHRDVECVDCHRGNEFSGTATQCASCHAIDDVHAGSNGTACQECHTTSTWQAMGFDHLGETGFALADGHGGLNCQDCHTREDFKDDLTSQCSGCHLNEDDHQGRNGEDCAQCHQPTEWSDSLFDHSDTGFKLHAKHAEVECIACHKEEVTVELPLTCGGCHQLDDSHAGQLGEDCGNCHTETEWHADVAFDHDLASFPLVGMHAAVACGNCHESNRFNDAETTCVGCHREDDVHKGSLGEACGDCHTPNDWLTADFDHDTQTDFPLTGAHASTICEGCHTDADDLSAVPSTCGGCHQSDDVHAGQFGMLCGDCHTTTEFSEIDRL